MDIFKYIPPAIAAVALLLCLAYYLRLWPLELLVSFAPLVTCLLLSAIGFCLLFIVVRHPVLDTLVVVSLILGVVFSLFSLWRSLTVQPLVHATATNSASSIRFATFNKEFSNHDYQKIGNYLKAQRVDVAVLQESTPEAIKQISRYSEMTNYYVTDNLNTVQKTGAAIISRYPIKQTQTIKIGAHSSLVRAVITTPHGKDLAFYSLHLVGPFSPNRYSNRGHDIASAAGQLASEKLPAVLGGDFNTTVYSPDLQQFNKLLRGSFQATTVQRWPQCTRYNRNPLTCLRIDHVYLPKKAQLVDTHISPNLGSDHRALVVTFNP